MILFLFTFVADIILIVLNGLSLTVFWDWFVSGQGLFGLPALTIAQSIGVVFLISYLWYRAREPRPSHISINEYVLRIIASNAVALVVFWAFALVLRIFI